jgi:hypothetical protein
MSDLYMDAMKPCPDCGAERWAGDPHICSIIYPTLREANIARHGEWCKGEAVPILFRAVECAGEVGELCNELKKLWREQQGYVGSRSDIEKVYDELGDAVVTLDLIAMDLGVALDWVGRRKFNKTSAKYGLKTRVKE